MSMLAFVTKTPRCPPVALSEAQKLAFDVKAAEAAESARDARLVPFFRARS